MTVEQAQELPSVGTNGSASTLAWKRRVDEP
jgi:hypothetical protein